MDLRASRMFCGDGRTGQKKGQMKLDQDCHKTTTTTTNSKTNKLQNQHRTTPLHNNSPCP
jgi:hypothetical protein